MKKSASTSLALAALALTAAGGIALLGGPNVFSVLSDIKFPSKPKIDKPPVEKKEVAIDEKQDNENEWTELALEAKASETKVEELKPEEPAAQKVQTKAAEEVVKPASTPKPQKEVQKTQNLKFTPPDIPEKATKKIEHGNGKYALIFPRGERIEYNEQGFPEWSSWQGRLTETEEEKRWRETYDSPLKGSRSGTEGTGKWCLTPAENYQVEDVDDCPKGRKQNPEKWY